MSLYSMPLALKFSDDYSVLNIIMRMSLGLMWIRFWLMLKSCRD